MQRTYGIYVVSILLVLPAAWILATVDFGQGSDAAVLMSLVGVTAGGLIYYLWRSHRRGKLLPNRCLTCGRGVQRIKPGEIKPPPGAEETAAQLRWRCSHCGRLA